MQHTEQYARLSMTLSDSVETPDVQVSLQTGSLADQASRCGVINKPYNIRCQLLYIEYLGTAQQTVSDDLIEEYKA